MSNHEQENDKDNYSIYSDDDIEACNVIVSAHNDINNILPAHNDTNTLRIINYEHSHIARTATCDDKNEDEYTIEQESHSYASTESDSDYEDAEWYVFYCYYTAILEEDEDNCVACEDLPPSENGEDAPDEHYDYNHLDCDALNNVAVFIRKKFCAQLKPNTRVKCNNLDGLYALADLCSWNEWNSNEYGKLADYEYVEDAYDSLLVCYDENEVEMDAYNYFRTYGIHMSLSGASEIAFAEWGDVKKHI